MTEEAKDPRAIFQKRKAAVAATSKGVLDDLEDQISEASKRIEENHEAFAAADSKWPPATEPSKVEEPEVEEPKQRARRKTIRFHPDVIDAIQKHATAERRYFNEVLREVVLEGMRIKGIKL